MSLLKVWYLDSLGSEESKSIVLKQSQVEIYKQKYEQEYSKLESISDKLDFFDNNSDLFEFPFNEFVVRKGKTILFEFNFKPAPHFLHTHIYNPWFIKRSKQYLSCTSEEKTKIPFYSCDELWIDFIEKIKYIPFLKKFIKYEKKRFKKLSEAYAPGRFDYWYTYNIVGGLVLGPRYELTKDYWQEISVREVVDYIIKLEKYKESKEPEIQLPIANKLTYQTLLDPINSIKSKVDLTILELFRHNAIKLETFKEILKAHNLLMSDGNWDKKNKAAELLPIIDFLEDGIIKKVSRSMLRRIFELEFGPIMSERRFSTKDHNYNLEPSLEEAMMVLKTKKK